MFNKAELEKTLKRIDGREYKAYKEIQNNWYDYGDFLIGIPYVQGDPFASPSSVFLRISQKNAEFPAWILENAVRIQAIEDFLTRAVAQAIKRHVRGNRGSGKSGIISIARTGQEVIERTSLEFNQDFIEARLSVGLPAKGRRILGYE